MELASRFKVACSNAGLSIDQVAQTLHVTTRTVRHWFSGKTAVPFAAYKLIRILNRLELPGDRWAGWHMHSGKIWTPEGFGFEPVDGLHWAGLVRRARLFSSVYAENSQLIRELAEARKPATRAEGQGAVDGASAASGLVSVSTSGLEGRGRYQDTPQSDIRLTSNERKATIPASHHFDYGLISCPTPSGSLKTSTYRHESERQPSESASTPSSAFASMPTFMVVGLVPLRVQQHQPRPSDSPQLLRAMPTGGQIGSTSTQTLICGPCSIPSSKLNAIVFWPDQRMVTLKPLSDSRRFTGLPASVLTKTALHWGVGWLTPLPLLPLAERTSPKHSERLGHSAADAGGAT